MENPHSGIMDSYCEAFCINSAGRLAEATEAERFPRLLFETIITGTDHNSVRDASLNQSLTYIQIKGVEKETQTMH